MLEFALVATLLMTLFLGLVSFARASNVYASITRAAREGARVAAMPDCVTCGNSYLDPSSGVTEANSRVFAGTISPALESANLNPEAVTDYSESVGWLEENTGEQQCGVTIRFEYPYRLGLPFLPVRLATIYLPVSVQMRRENQPLAGSCP